MKKDGNTFQAELFYSYSHKDERYRSNMETALSQLRRDKLLKEWSDHKILPGQSISERIKDKMNEVNIIVFLLSPDFLDSDACLEEWEYAKKLENEGKLVFRIPIILRDCSWIDFLGDDDVKVLPNDGRHVTKFNPQVTAWQQVYNGIKGIINELKNTFKPKLEYVRKLEKTDFFSLEHVKLQDIFVFPTLFYYVPSSNEEKLRIRKIKDQKELLEKEYILIHGEEKSGKTALGRYIFLSLANNLSTPVLYINLEEISQKPIARVFYDEFCKQFSGDYSLWKKQAEKTLILDNLSSKSRIIDIIEYAKLHFEKVIITTSTDIYTSFFYDDERLSEFREMEITTLSYQQQETLIRKTLTLSNRNEPVPDGRVDQVEKDVNSIITFKKIVPRYPFFVLSILQTYEAFIPDDLSITSYGHCYQVLILTNFRDAGIADNDKSINTCFNFLEKLAFRIFEHAKLQNQTEFDYDAFVKQYSQDFIIPDAILNRLRREDYGIINKDGSFKQSYMYYFFLGRYLSRRDKEKDVLIKAMCEHSYIASNYLTLLFIIHHTNDNEIIEDILLGTMLTLDTYSPATLNQSETDVFQEIVDKLPDKILSDDSAEEIRQKERELRDISDNLSATEDEVEVETEENPVNDIYHILKNNEIMRQILRNRYGTLEKMRIKEIIQTITESGLRLVKIGLVDEDWITNTAHYLQRKHPNLSFDKTKRVLQFLSFIWTLINIRKIVSSINVPEIKEVVNEVVQTVGTPAYDLIGYFNHLYSEEELTIQAKQELEALLKQHDDIFFHRVLSLETQYYMNTHRSDHVVEQSICSLLGLDYVHTPLDSLHKKEREEPHKRKRKKR